MAGVYVSFLRGGFRVQGVELKENTDGTASSFKYFTRAPGLDWYASALKCLLQS